MVTSSNNPTLAGGGKRSDLQCAVDFCTYGHKLGFISESEVTRVSKNGQKARRLIVRCITKSSVMGSNGRFSFTIFYNKRGNYLSSWDRKEAQRLGTWLNKKIATRHKVAADDLARKIDQLALARLKAFNAKF